MGIPSSHFWLTEQIDMSSDYVHIAESLVKEDGRIRRTLVPHRTHVTMSNSNFHYKAETFTNLGGVPGLYCYAKE